MYHVWAAYCVVAFVSFVGLEAYAIWTGQPTFSQFVWDFAKAFPFGANIVCLILGGLVVHFFWTKGD